MSSWAKEYVEWKGYVPDVYGDIIARNLKLKQFNYAKSGTNNYAIFQTICDSINEIKENDVVIIQWTQVSRFRLVNRFNEWEDFYADVTHYKEKLKKCDDISKSTISEILVNRTNDKHSEEIVSWEKIINKTLTNNKILFWSPFVNISGYGKILKSMETIAIETDGKIPDPHFSEKGQKDLANILLNKLDNKKFII
jgi:hypothetical protein